MESVTEPMAEHKIQPNDFQACVYSGLGFMVQPPSPIYAYCY